MTKKIIDAKPYKNSISAPIIKIGVTAISIGMIVMIVSVGVGIGMQKEIKDKISAFEGDISIQSFNNTINENSVNPILPSVEFLEDLRKFVSTSIWPFESCSSKVVLAEIYPSMYIIENTEIIKDANQVKTVVKQFKELDSSGDLYTIMNVTNNLVGPVCTQ